MVLVIVSIVAVVGASLFASKSDYAVYVAKQQLIASALLAQQSALANQDPATPLSLTISQSPTLWTLSVVRGGGTPVVLHSQQIEREGATLTIDSTPLTTSYTLTYDREANLVPRANHRMILNGSQSATLCFSSSGYAYETTTGACP